MRLLYRTGVLLLLLVAINVECHGYGFDRARRDASGQHANLVEEDEVINYRRARRSPGKSSSSSSSSSEESKQPTVTVSPDDPDTTTTTAPTGENRARRSPHHSPSPSQGHSWLSNLDLQSWLDAEQMGEVKAAGDSMSTVHKLRHLYDGLPSAGEKVEAAKKIVRRCYEWLPEVTSQQEREDLFSLHHHDHNACKEKVSEYMERLSVAKQEQLKKYWSFCEHVWYDSHSADTTRGLSHDHGHHHPGHSHPMAGDQHHPSHHQHQSPIQEPIPGSRHSRTRRDNPYDGKLEELLYSHLNWLSDAQKTEMRTMKAEGKSRADKQAKLMEFYDVATGETKAKATEHLKAGCRELVDTVLGEEKVQELKLMKESGTPGAEIGKKVDAMLAEITDAGKKELIAEYKAHCKKIFGVPTTSLRRRRDQPHPFEGKLEELLTTHLSWLNDEQKAELRTMKAEGKSRADKQAKLMQYFEGATGEAKEKAIEKFKAGCSELTRSVIGDEKHEELKRMHEAGTPGTEIGKKMDSYLDEITDEGKKKLIAEYRPHCKKIWKMSAASLRRRRDQPHPFEGKLEELLTTHLSWLNDEQKAELKKMKAEGKSRADKQAKLLEYFEGATGEAKEKAIEKFKAACSELTRSVIGDEKHEELKRMREAGTPGEEIAKKAEAYVGEVTDEGKKALIAEYKPHCKKIWKMSATSLRRRRRGQPHPFEGKLEELLTTYLSWLNDEQKAELVAMKAAGKSRADKEAKLMQFFEAATGEPKEKAIKQFKAGCSELTRSVIGDEKHEELKRMKEAGTPDEEIGKKANAYLDEITDEGKKALIAEYRPYCRKIWKMSTTSLRRRRRDHPHEGKMEKLFETHLSWLTDSQKEELRALKSAGKSRGEIQAKILEFYNSASGDLKEKAGEHLKAGCREMLSKAIGEEKVNEIKQLKESGAAKEEVAKKIESFLATITDESQKNLLAEYGGHCKKLFGVASSSSRRRRDHHLPGHEGHHLGHHGNHSLEDYFKTHLNWLNDAQREELKALKAAGKGRSEIQAKIMEYYNSATGEVKEKATQQLRAGCDELLRVIVGEEKYNEYEQMKQSGATLEEQNKKVAALMAGVTDEKKKSILAEYGPQCKQAFRGRRRRDTSPHQDHHFSHHGNHTLEDYFKTHLSWLDDAQKEELRGLKASGKGRPEIQAKVMDYYKAATGEVKEKATEHFKAGCFEMLRSVAGDEKANEIKQIRESGTAMEEMAKKVESILDEISDEKKKAMLAEYGPHCRKLFGVPPKAATTIRRRRDHQHHHHHHVDSTTMNDIVSHTLEDHIQHHLSWLNDEQKEGLRTMKARGDSKRAIQEKVLEFYNASRGEIKTKATEALKCGCRQLLKKVIGDTKYEELKELEKKESGLSRQELVSKADEYLKQAGEADEEKQELIDEYGSACHKLLTEREQTEGAVKSRRRRSRYTEDGDSDTDMDSTTDNNQLRGRTMSGMRNGAYEEGTNLQNSNRDSNVGGNYGALDRDLNSQYSWLTDEQKAELRQHHQLGNSEFSIQQKALEFFDSAPESVKSVAKSLLISGCEKLMAKLFGEDKAEELRQMREAGTDGQEVRQKMQELASQMEDEGEKAEAMQYGSTCQSIFEMIMPSSSNSSSRRRRNLPPEPLSTRGMGNQRRESSEEEGEEVEPMGLHHGEEGPAPWTNIESPAVSRCRQVLFAALGDERLAELREWASKGAGSKWLRSKVHYYLEELQWEGDTEHLNEFTNECRELFGIDPPGNTGHESGMATRQRKVGSPWANVVIMDEE